MEKRIGILVGCLLSSLILFDLSTLFIVVDLSVLLNLNATAVFLYSSTVLFVRIA